MKDLVLVDAQAARVRMFREAIAVYRERLQNLRTRTREAHAEAERHLERARRHSQAVHASFAARKAVRRHGALAAEEIRLHVFPSKEEALKFLRLEPPYEWAPRPAVVFTDLHLEEGSGLSVVERLKADPGLRDIPAVVLCCGASPIQVREAWDAGSNAVVDLPLEPHGMLGRVADTLEFWLQEPAL